MGSQRALGRGRRTPAELDTVLVNLVDRVTARMRKAERAGRTVMLRLRFDDFSRATRSRTLCGATTDTEIILATARDLLAGAMPTIYQRGVTLVGISVGNFDSKGAIQLMLPFNGYPADALDHVLDNIHDRYGNTAITRAILLGRDPGWEMPRLPD